MSESGEASDKPFKPLKPFQLFEQFELSLKGGGDPLSGTSVSPWNNLLANS